VFAARVPLWRPLPAVPRSAQVHGGGSSWRC
ncbi:hypothetical protein BN1723_020073, partial [Verticillium longisporum]